MIVEAGHFAERLSEILPCASLFAPARRGMGAGFRRVRRGGSGDRRFPRRNDTAEFPG